MRNYQIFKADIKKNKEDILAILKRNLNEVSGQRYIWNYENNPYGKAHNWLAREENSGQFVGSGTLFPRRIFLNGQPVLVAIAGDFALDEEHRAYGPALKLQRTIQSSIENNGFSLIYGFPNKLSEAVFLRIGYIELGSMERYVKILRSEYKLKDHLKPSVITKLFSKIVDSTMKWFSREANYRKSSESVVKNLNSFDERFNELWESASKQFKTIGERNSKFLNWRYIQFPFRRYHIFSLLNTKNKIAGYVVHYVENNICFIADMLFSDAEVLDSLLFEFIRYARKKGIFSISISYLGSVSLINKLKRWGFQPRQNQAKVLLYCDNDLSFSNFLLNKENWYFFEGDSDI